MLKDEVVAEVHRVRAQYSAKFDNDIDAIYEDIRRQQAESDREFASFRRQPPEQFAPKLPIRK